MDHTNLFPAALRESAPLAAALLCLAATLALFAAAPDALAETGGAGGQAETGSAAGERTPFDRQGMWIWYVERAEGGSVAAILSRARRAGIGTVYVKAGDGGSAWGQFSRGLVRGLRAGGLDVCAWQFVYGDRPLAEARVGAAAVEKGAECLVIDAEGAYEGKYAAADLYIRSLRARIGSSFPLSLATFPYVDYHPSFPYSVFFGPGGATHNQPQMYWRTIQTSVRDVYEHTYLFNRLWGHPIHPVGQTYDAPGVAELKLFRRLASTYGPAAPSWWEWDKTAGREWGALAALDGAEPLAGLRPSVEHPTLSRGERGDLVVWAQQRLRGAQQEVAVSGVFGRETYRAVRAFQAELGLAPSGAIDTDTWQALLGFPAEAVRWSGGVDSRGMGGASAHRERSGGAAGSSGGAPTARVLVPRRPLSAALPARAYEIDPGPEMRVSSRPRVGDSMTISSPSPSQTRG